MRKKVLLHSCFLILFNSIGFNAMSVEDQKFIIIVNSSADTSALSKQKLRAIFSRNIKYWENGSQIRVFVLPNDNEIHKGFTKSRLGFYPYQLQRNWDRLSFTTMVIPPTIVKSEQEMLLAIQKNEGAIGYIATNNLLQGSDYVQSF